MNTQEPKLTPQRMWGVPEVYTATFTTPNAEQTVICVVKATANPLQAPSDFIVTHDVASPQQYRDLPDDYFISRAAAAFEGMRGTITR